MNNKNIYHTLPFIIFYRFLKSYNIQVKYDIIKHMFPDETDFYYIDHLVGNYLNFCDGNEIDKRIKSLSFHYVSILDFLWRVYVRNNYDHFSFITEGTCFFLKERRVISNEIYYSSGKRYYNGLKQTEMNDSFNNTENIVSNEEIIRLVENFSDNKINK